MHKVIVQSNTHLKLPRKCHTRRCGQTNYLEKKRIRIWGKMIYSVMPSRGPGSTEDRPWKKKTDS